MKNCLFCDAVVSIKKMLDHVAAHLERGDPMPNANKGGDHEACELCEQQPHIRVKIKNSWYDSKG